MPTSRRHDLDSGYSTGSFYNAANFSNAVMDDSYELQNQSRGRDHRLLSQMNNALHTDSPSTSSLLSSRSSKPRSSSQLQHKPRRSTRLDSPGTDPIKTSKLSDSLKVSKISDSLTTSKPFGSLKLSKISDSLSISKPSTKPKPSESLQLVKMPDSLETAKIAGIDRSSPVVEHARGLLNRHRTFGINSELDSIAATAITAPRDLKSDFFSVSPLTNYIKTRWNINEDLPAPLAIEEAPRPTNDLYKNPYIDSDDEDYESSLIQQLNKNRKTGDLLKSLRENKLSPDYTAAGISDDDSAKGAYAIQYVIDDGEDEKVVEKPRIKYELQDSPNEMALSHLVSSAALRARTALENLTGLIGKGGLVNVEGDVKPYGGALTTFRLHTPFHFQGPLMIGEKPALSVGDDTFERYLVGLFENRKEERDKVDKEAIRMTKMNRSLNREPPKQYSLKPIGYINDNVYDSFSQSLVPYTSKFDKTSIPPSRKKVHFDEGDEEKKPTLSLSSELVPFAPKGIDDGEMAMVPRKKRYPVYEYTEEIPIKCSFTDGDVKERLSVLERIRIKALLVGEDKLEDPDRLRTRKPRTQYYANKLKKTEPQEDLSSIMTFATPHATVLKASKPPKDLSYRLDSRLDPEILIPKSTGYGRMRDQVRDVEERLHYHRLLMDRHTDRPLADVGAAARTTEGGVAGGVVAGGGGGGDVLGKEVSPLRKKLRDVICKSRRDPSYYDLD